MRTARSWPTNPITFVAPRVDDATQTVLVKSAAQGRAADGCGRSSSSARGSSGSTAPGLTVPVVAVTRINGKYFCFVAEHQGERASSRASARWRSAS